MRAARDIHCLPDGSPIPHGLKHALLVLASYYPNVWPSQHRLAADMGIDRRNVNRRLKTLENAGLIGRLYRGPNRSTLYRLDLQAIRACDASATYDCDGSVPVDVAAAPQEDQ
jgi:DNA-binding IscR family transcriptional regulator